MGESVSGEGREGGREKEGAELRVVVRVKRDKRTRDPTSSNSNTFTGFYSYYTLLHLASLLTRLQLSSAPQRNLRDELFHLFAAAPFLL